MMPSRAFSNWVMGGEFAACGRKSHAVSDEGSGMPGVSGDENVNGPPIAVRLAKLPGVVPCAVDEGLSAPSDGRPKRSLFGLVLLDWIISEPSLHVGKKLAIARRWD